MDENKPVTDVEVNSETVEEWEEFMEDIEADANDTDNNNDKVETEEQTDPPEMDEMDGKNELIIGEGLTPVNEETIKPMKASTTSSIRKRINLVRTDGFRSALKKRPAKSFPDEVNSDAMAVNENELNDSLEATQQNSEPKAPLSTNEAKDESPTHDSLGRPISGLGPVIAHTSLTEDGPDVDKDPADDSSSEADSVNTEDGINDSIANLDLLKGYLYSIMMWVVAKLFGLLESGVTYVYNNYLGGNMANGVQEEKPEAAKDETDTDENKKQQEEATRKRVYNICHELLTTERAYAKRLKVLSTIKVQTATILQPEVAKSMFQNVEVIHQFHQENLLPQLEERIASWNDQQRIGDIMRKLVPFLKLYTEYVKDFQKANELFEQWRQKSSTFATFVEEAENNIDYGRLKVQAHMLEPVQRVPRYELLLKDYLKHIPQDSADRPDAEEALQLVGGAAKHFEEMMKRDSRIVELMRLQAQFEGTVNFVSPDREFHHQGKVKEVHSKAGKVSDRVLHLFNDLLLMSSHQKYLVQDDKFRVKHEIPLKSLKVSYGNNLEVPYTFFLRTPDIVLELSAGTAGERRMWFLKLTRAVRKLNREDNAEDDTGNDNEASIEDSQLHQRYTFQVTADLKTWKKRILSLYENGMLTTSKTNHEKGTLATVHIRNFHVGIGNVSQKKTKALSLVGENRTYCLFDESEKVVESWFEVLKSYRDRYAVDTEMYTSAESAPFVRDSQSRMSTASTDSGIDAMSYSSLNSQASFDTP